MKLSELPIPIPKVLIWGKPGCGKTPFITSYGKGLQVIDLDRGMGSSMTLSDKWKESRKDVDVIDCFESDATKAQSWSLFKKTLASIYAECVKGTYPYEVLAIDSFTTLASNVLRSILANSNKLGQSGAMTQQFWGLAISEIENQFAYIQALPIPVVVTFHDREVTEGAGTAQVTYQEIAIYGKNLPRTLISVFNEVWRQCVRTTGGKMTPYLQTVPDAYSLCRSGRALKNETLTDLGLKEVLNLLGWTPLKKP